jgi:uncharacterized RDD family membrane protein YckC
MLTENETQEQVYPEPSYELVQASAGKRFANYLIDLLFFYMVIIFWGVITAVVSPSTFEGMEESDNPFGSFSDRILTMIAYAIVMGVIEAIFRGKSIGKFITKTKAVNGDGSDISLGTAFARGFSRAVPFEAFNALGNPSYPWHDKWTNTYVIDEKATREYNEQLTNG